MTAGWYGLPQSLLQPGLVMRAVGDTMFLCPPLVITEAEIDELVSLIRTALDKTEEDLNG
ncbi:MAG: hypothetical protein R3C58_00760 [Parvularculaceae bacterium]